MPDKCQFLITFEVNQNSISSFEDMLGSVQTELPKVEGCQNVNIFRHDDPESNKFTLFETWDSKPLHQDHVVQMQESGQWAKIEKMLNRQPTGCYLLMCQ